MLTMKIVEKSNNFAKLEKRLQALRKKSLEVGWFPNQGPHPTTRGDLTFAQLAAIHHYGSQKVKIPSRPILTIGLLKEKIGGFKTVKVALKDYFSNIKSPNTNFTPALTKTGEALVSSIKPLFGVSSSAIKPNTAFTSSLKGGNSPLVETGALRDALTFKIGG